MSKGQSAEELRTRMQHIDPYEFEHFVADLWETRGWDTEVSQGSNDMGVDIEAWKDDGLVNQKAVIQAKRYADDNKIGRPKIQQYHTLKEQDSEADAAVVVTTSGFHDTAEEWANEHNVKLVDGEDLVQTVRENHQEDLVDEYAPQFDEIRDRESGDSITKEESEETSQSSSSPTDSDYFGLVGLSFIAQVAGLVIMLVPSFLPVVPPNQGVWVFVLGWLAAPFLVFADAWELHKSDASYKPNRLAWPVVVTFLMAFGMFLYLYKRAKA